MLEVICPKMILLFLQYLKGMIAQDLFKSQKCNIYTRAAPGYV